jgi:hypothetical protein
LVIEAWKSYVSHNSGEYASFCAHYGTSGSNLFLIQFFLSARLIAFRASDNLIDGNEYWLIVTAVYLPIFLEHCTLKSLKVRCYFGGMNRPIQNLGDGLTAHLLSGLGFECVGPSNNDADLINPGRCLLAIGSLLAGEFLQKFETSYDVWGTGFRGFNRWGLSDTDVVFHAVRGPHTAEEFRLPANTPLGDPGLLIPFIYPKPRELHGKSVVLPHFSRLDSPIARGMAASAGCDEQMASVTFTALDRCTHQRLDLKGILTDLWQFREARTRNCASARSLIDRIAGASFVLTGSLHGAILAQAYGVPWAAFNDGFVDTPAKWDDWAAYLGVNFAFVRTLYEGREWWQECGRFGQIRDLRPLVEAFPYMDLSEKAQALAKRVDAMPHSHLKSLGSVRKMVV